MRVAVILNPISGARGRPGSVEDCVRLATGLLGAEGVDAEVHVTAYRRHGFELARAAVGRGASLVFAWGGDGTVNDVGAALAFGTVPLAVIPAGSGNGLARELRLPRKPAAAIRVGLHGTDRVIDVGELGARLFFDVAGLGLDACVAARFNARARGRRGVVPYLGLAARELLAYRPREYRLVVDGETLRCRALLVACANSRQYGGGAVVASRARVDDGALDLVVVGEQSPLRGLWEARRLFTGTLERAPGVVTRRFTRMEIAGEGPLLFHVDGEPVEGGERLTARVHPGALRIRTAGSLDRRPDPG